MKPCLRFTCSKIAIRGSVAGAQQSLVTLTVFQTELDDSAVQV